jgi:hypothetical protein
MGAAFPFGAPEPTVVADPSGWVIVNANSITPILAGDPPVAGAAVPLSGVERGPFVSGGNPIGLLYARGAKAFFRAVEFFAARRRAVSP